MSHPWSPIGDDDLHAYVDGQLPSERRAEVEAYLRRNPHAAQLVRSYEGINQGLRTLFEEGLDEPAPIRLSARRPVSSRWLRLAVAAATVALSIGIGWSLHGIVDRPQPLIADLVTPAAFAHYVFATDASHPVEVNAANSSLLVKWLSSRLDAPLQAPDLRAEGFELLGGRLLPSTERMAAQFMYQDAQGQRVTLYQRKGAWGDTDRAFGYALHDGIAVLFWTRGQMGYALSGMLSRERLLALAVAVRDASPPHRPHVRS